MLYLILACSFAVAQEIEPGGGVKDHTLAKELLDEYQRNLEAFPAAGTMRFLRQRGVAEEVAPKVEEVQRVLKSDWKRQLTSRDGLYLFDGSLRRFESLATPEQIEEQRAAANGDWSFLPSVRMLTEGRFTLVDSISFGARGAAPEHHASLVSGGAAFFQTVQGIPLQIGHPILGFENLGKCLTELLESSRGVTVTLAEVDEQARLDHVPVVKLRFEIAIPRVNITTTFWIDRDRGAIPLQTVKEEVVRDQLYLTAEFPNRDSSQLIQVMSVDHEWIRKFHDCWVPLRWREASITAFADQDRERLMIDEYAINETDFDHPPDHALFALEFPEPVQLLDQYRSFDMGTRKVWTVKDISVKAREAAWQDYVTHNPSPPEGPSNVDPEIWLPYLPLLAGLFIFLIAGLRIYGRSRREP